MRIDVIAKNDFQAAGADYALVLPLFQDALQDALAAPEAGVLRPLVEDEVIRGKCEEVYFLPTPGAAQKGVLAMGLGKRDAFNAEALRRSAAKAAEVLQRHRIRTLVLDTTGNDALPVEAFIEGVILAQYRFDKYKAQPKDDALPTTFESLTVLVKNAEKVDAAKERFALAGTVSRNTNWARDLGNTAPNEMTPSAFADAAKTVAKETGCAIDVLDEAHMQRLGMNALLGVAKGSEQRAVLVIMRYTHPEATRTLALVGERHHLRHGRHQHQAGAKHARDEIRHVRRRGPCSP